MTPLLLMADYGADPLWHRTPAGKGNPMICLDTLPLSTELKGRLRTWARRHDELMDPVYAGPSATAEAEWVAKGQALLEPLRRELGPEYDVEYFEGETP